MSLDSQPQQATPTPVASEEVTRLRAERLEAVKDIPVCDETEEHAVILTADEYFGHVIKPDTRSAFWKWEDVEAKLEELAQDPLREAERRFCTTVNTDTGELAGAVPFIFIGWQVINPGEHVPPHRHSSFAIYHILQGEGRTVVQSAGEDWITYSWKKGDTLACPAWAYHEHFADGDEKAMMYVVQDAPMLVANRTLFWEEPMGQEHIRHLTAGKAASYSATRVDD